MKYTIPLHGHGAFKHDDETLPNFVKRKHPRKGEKKKQRARTKVEARQRAPKRRATSR